MAGRVGFHLCLITDGMTYPESALVAALSAVPEGSVAVQLRNRGLGGADLLRLAERLRTLTAAARAPLFINDRLDVALAVGAEGIHLPGHGLPPRRVRHLLETGLLVSCASHSLVEARLLAAEGADCVTFGPIWPTPSKPDDPAVPASARVAPVGPAALAEAAAALPVPVFALGGVDTSARAAACAAAGARVACLRAVLAAADPAAAARAFLAAVRPGP